MVFLLTTRGTQRAAGSSRCVWGVLVSRTPLWSKRARPSWATRPGDALAQLDAGVFHDFPRQPVGHLDIQFVGFSLQEHERAVASMQQLDGLVEDFLQAHAGNPASC